ncbi:hypothetical protein AGMMS50293_15130 [Spirochaetia bacterium]|nr:hypothetical protein AGMMS50293_15130 [Spirochaetia bacterium]
MWSVVISNLEFLDTGLAGLEPVYSVSGISDWTGLAYRSIPATDDVTWDAAVMGRNKSGYRLPMTGDYTSSAAGLGKARSDSLR